MIKIKLHSIDGKAPEEIKIINGELLSEAVERSVGNICAKDSLKDTFRVILNGNLIPPELWVFTKLQSSDSVLIAPTISSGDSGSMFKTLAIVLVSVYVGNWAQAIWTSGVTSGLVTAAATIGASLLLNSLFPPPGVDLGSGLGTSDSQMYSINGQSNQVKKFNFVPKVYGTYRMFPNVAANPYVEIEVDPVTGKTIQFFYAIYDFGLGPAMVQDVKIGDTKITEFTDVTYNFVDLNRPVSDEGDWDTNLKSSFSIYKGDVSSDNVSYALNSNRISGGDPSDYEVVRNSGLNPGLRSQEITLNFICPKGLYAYSAVGDIGNRNIYLEIKFSKADEENWQSFNDTTLVSGFKAIGGDQDFQKKNINLYPQNYSQTIYRKCQPDSPLTHYLDSTIYSEYRGLLKGDTYFIAADGLTLGSTIYVGDKIVGKISSSTFHSTIGLITYNTYNLESPLAENIPLFAYSSYSGFDGYSWQSNVITFSSNVNIMTSVIAYLGNFKISAADTSPIYSVVKFTPIEPGEYKVKVTRVSSSSTYTSTVMDELAWSNIVTRTETDPIVTDKRHVFLEIKIKATDQLSGTIQNLSGLTTSALEVWDGVSWSRQLTRNPAWVYTDLLIGSVNKRPIDKSRLDLLSLKEWADFCDEVPTSPPSSTPYVLPRFESNFVLDFNSTLQSLISQVTSAAQASMNIIDGNYGVLIDKIKTVPIQVFTPRNSWGFTSTRNYTQAPDALKVSYIDPGTGWQVTEKIVYDDGFTSTNSVLFDAITSFGVTNHEQAWRFGRYCMAQNRLRQEHISINVDFEHLVCTRGDYVQITQDVMKAGGFPARVKTVSGSQITIDDAIDTLPVSYGFVYRGIDGTIYTNTLTVNNSDTFTLNGINIPAVGDLIIIGEVGQIVMECIVKSIVPNDDLSATLSLVEKADGIYTAESTDTIPQYVPQISTVRDSQYYPPGEVEGLVVAENSFRCSGGGYEYFVDLDWEVPIGAAYDIFEVYVDAGKGYDLKDVTKNSFYRYIENDSDLGKVHNFKVLAVSANGLRLDLNAVGYVTATPNVKTTPPSNVGSLSIDITGEVLQLSWTRIDDCDCSEYLIRFSPITSATWEASIPLLRVDANTSMASVQARVGTYLIKAIDFAGNESNLAAEVITTVPSLFGLNIIETINDFPTLDGSFDATRNDGSALVLMNSVVGGVETSEYYPSGYYYYKNLLDLGEIYTVRLQTLIHAEGFTLEDLMSNWVTLDAVAAMSNSKYSEWDVEAQYRTTDQYNVMSVWPDLSSLITIGEGSEDIWTSWKKITAIGDATGRIFQFRLKLISNKVSVSPRVFDGEIRADMPDRFETYNNLVDSGVGYTLAYSPAFAGPGSTPNIQISIENASSGDYWTFDYKSLTGFGIKFFDKTDNQVGRTFDVAVKGYGRRNTTVI